MTTIRSADRLAGHGLAVSLPATWEGRIYQRPAAPTGSPAVTAPAGQLATTGRNHPVLHLANFALPGSRGDYGTGAVERMRPGQIFIALLQFGDDCLGSALFAPSGLPTVRAADFNPNGLQRKVAGQAGFQHFFTMHGKHPSRPMCLYVVLGAHRQAGQLCAQINDVLGQIEVTG